MENFQVCHSNGMVVGSPLTFVPYVFITVTACMLQFVGPVFL